MDKYDLTKGVFSFCTGCKTLVKIENINTKNAVVRALIQRPGTLFLTPCCELCAPKEELKDIRAKVHRFQNPALQN